MGEKQQTTFSHACAAGPLRGARRGCSAGTGSYVPADGDERPGRGAAGLGALWLLAAERVLAVPRAPAAFPSEVEMPKLGQEEAFQQHSSCQKRSRGCSP